MAVTHWRLEKFAEMLQEKADEPGLAHWTIGKILKGGRQGVS